MASDGLTSNAIAKLAKVRINSSNSDNEDLETEPRGLHLRRKTIASTVPLLLKLKPVNGSEDGSIKPSSGPNPNAPLKRSVSLGENVLPVPNGGEPRRLSMFKGMVQSITGMLKLRRLTVPKIDKTKPKIRYENTYKTSPDVGETFAMSSIARVAGEILQEEIGDKEYNVIKGGELACQVSNKIKNKVKDMQLKRYKIVCQVVISQVLDQGVEAASRCLWDPKTDNYTTVSYRNDSIMAVAMIFGVYFE